MCLRSKYVQPNTEINIPPSKTVIANVEEDENGDQYLVFGENELDSWGWQVNDTLEWKINDDGSIIIENQSWKERNSGKDDTVQSNS